ncbi:hypothetical protein [Hydrogenimonas sp. SS33]|uniref:hypothetical protein n=1 Tax=Hydrogenimonas leucolamina TaxID=2954236 RepID=UPI00336BF001
MKTTWSIKLLIFNIVVAVIAVVSYLLHATTHASLTVKLIFYPFYGYTFISFIPASIAAVLGALEYQKGEPAGRIGLWGNALYAVVSLVGVFWFWVATMAPQSAS